MVKLSLLISYYKTIDLTEKLLKELSIQKTKDVEIIVVDDGCNEKRLDKYSKIANIIHLENNVGMSSALNVALDNANGEYIGFIDGDDQITMDYVDILLETLKTHNEDIIYFNWADFNMNNIITHPQNYALWKAIYRKEIFPRFVEGRRIENDVPVQNELRAKEHTEYYIDRVLYIYNSHRPDSITWNKYEERKNEIKVVVLSCDKNTDIFDAFHRCMEKYWKNNPEIIYITNTIQNPYYKTICKDYPLDKWTVGIREALKEIDSEKILIIMDDFFIRRPVDAQRLYDLIPQLKGNIAHLCFETSYDEKDEETEIKGFKKRQHGVPYEVSINCGLWDKEKFINVLDRDCDPWTIELVQDNKGYDYYINSEDFIIDWGYRTWIPTGLFKGKWCRNIIPFFEQEGIEIDYEKRGFYD